MKNLLCRNYFTSSTHKVVSRNSKNLDTIVKPRGHLLLHRVYNIILLFIYNTFQNKQTKLKIYYMTCMLKIILILIIYFKNIKLTALILI